MRLILGSQSPRRKEILNYFAIPFVQIPSSFDEASIDFKGDPVQYAEELSLKKAQALASRFSGDVILTADTVVYQDGKIFNKPKNEEEAFQMLRAFSGRWQQVFTGVTVQRDQVVYTACEETRILFHSLTDEQIGLYLGSASFLDKAGGYAVQAAGSILISRLDGCYYNVMGLPVNRIKELLHKVGLDLWKHLKPF